MNVHKENIYHKIVVYNVIQYVKVVKILQLLALFAKIIIILIITIVFKSVLLIQLLVVHLVFNVIYHVMDAKIKRLIA